MDHFGHRSWGHEQGQIRPLPQDRGFGDHPGDIPQDPWTEEKPIERAIIEVPGDQIGSRGGIEGPCLLRNSLSGGLLKIICINDGGQWGLIIFQSRFCGVLRVCFIPLGYRATPSDLAQDFGL
jgi:hypothetical protein